jgi:hypothetical protein
MELNLVCELVLKVLEIQKKCAKTRIRRLKN